MVFKPNKVWNFDRRDEKRRAKWLPESFLCRSRAERRERFQSFASSLRTIRAAIDRYLEQPPIKKSWSIVGDPAFETANKVLNAICRKNAQEGKAGSIVHKQPIAKEQVEQLFRTGQLGECHTQDPAQLLRPTWFYITLYFGKKGRENQRKRTKEMLSLQSTPQGRQYYELRNLLGSKNHQGGLHDSNDESDGKTFAGSTEFAKMPGKNSAKLLKSPKSLN